MLHVANVTTELITTSWYSSISFVKALKIGTISERFMLMRESNPIISLEALSGRSSILNDDSLKTYSASH
jgi:hypothetical protein